MEAARNLFYDIERYSSTAQGQVAIFGFIANRIIELKNQPKALENFAEELRGNVPILYTGLAINSRLSGAEKPPAVPKLEKKGEEERQREATDMEFRDKQSSYPTEPRSASMDAPIQQY